MSDNDETSDETRVPTPKWQHLPERIDPSEMVETIEHDPQVEEISAVNYGQEFVRFDHH